MIERIRRWRLITLLLLLATPAIGGTALQALHPCPESAPWTAAATDAADSHAGHHGAPAGDSGAPSDHTGHTGECHCVGACAAAALVVAPAPVTVVALHTDAAPAPVFAVHSEAPRARPADRLPPATAPPLI